MRSYGEFDNGNSPRKTLAVLLGDKCQTKYRLFLGKSLKTQKCHWPFLMKNHVCCGIQVRSDSGCKFSQKSRVGSQLADSQSLGYTVGISGPSTNGTWMDTYLPQRSSCQPAIRVGRLESSFVNHIAQVVHWWKRPEETRKPQERRTLRDAY